MVFEGNGLFPVFLDAVDQRRDQYRQPARHFLAASAEFPVEGRHAFSAPADLLRQIPARKRFMMSVTEPGFLHYLEIELQLLFRMIRMPVTPGVVSAEKEFHAQLVRKFEKHFNQIRHRSVTVLAPHQYFRGIGQPLFEAAPDHDHGVDSDGAHIQEIPPPLPPPPVLVRNVIRDFIQESSGYFHYLNPVIERRRSRWIEFCRMQFYFLPIESARPLTLTPGPAANCFFRNGPGLWTVLPESFRFRV